MIVIADLHIGRKSDTIMIGATPRRDIDISARLTEVVRVAQEHGDSTIVVAGDVFDTVHPRVEAIGIYGKFLADCGRAGIDVYHIPGNHDCDVRLANLQMFTSLAMDNVVEVFDPGIYEIEGTRVAFFPHLPRHVLDRIEEEHGSYSQFFAEHVQFNEADVVIGHAMVKGVQYENDIFFEAANAMVFDLEQVAPFGTAILGHIHDQTEITDRKGRVIYPGSLTVNNFGEVEDEKGYIRLAKDGPQWFPYESSITPYQLVEIDLVSKDHVNFDPETIRPLAEDSIIKIVVRARSRAQVDELAIKRAFNQFGYVSRFEVDIQREEESRRRADEDTREAIKTNLNPDEVFDQYMDEQKAGRRVKELARQIGHEVIAEVRDAEAV